MLREGEREIPSPLEIPSLVTTRYPFEGRDETMRHLERERGGIRGTKTGRSWCSLVLRGVNGMRGREGEQRKMEVRA